MADKECLKVLKKGVDNWNEWLDTNRTMNPRFPVPDLKNADFSWQNLDNVDFEGCNLNGANLEHASLKNAYLGFVELSEAKLYGARLNAACLEHAQLRKANLHGADLDSVNLTQANLSGAYLHRALLPNATLRFANMSRAEICDANLKGANLFGANLESCNLQGVDLREADLSNASLVGADLRGAYLRGAKVINANLSHALMADASLISADITGCLVYGISTWNTKLDGANQANLIITGSNEPVITVDNLEIAQFVHLLLNHEKIRQVIDTITSKVVLILGRFTTDRKAVLDMLRDGLRKRNYLPILFDFEKPASRDITETIATLAHMARFVIADITDAKSIPQELQRIVPDLPSVPVQPLLLASEHEYGMFEHFKHYPWVLPTYLYESKDELLASIVQHVIEPAEKKLTELHAGTPRQLRRASE